MAKKQGNREKTEYGQNSRNRRHDNSRSMTSGNKREFGQKRRSFVSRRKPTGKADDKRYPRYSYMSKPLEEETVEDVKADIERIQKEISLEIKEIRSLKL